MARVKLLLAVVLLAALSAFVSAGLLDHIQPTIMHDKYKHLRTKEVYHYTLQSPDGSTREEVGVIVNPGTPNEELLVMGMYKVYDEKSNINTVTMYTTDKNGYKSNYKIMRHILPKIETKISITALKSAV